MRIMKLLDAGNKRIDKLTRDNRAFLVDGWTLRLFLGAVILVGMLAAWFLRAQVDRFPLTIALAGLLLVGYGCLCWQGGRRALPQGLAFLRRTWLAWPPAVRNTVGGAMLVLLLLINLRYLLQLPFTLDANQYRVGANGQVETIVKGQAKDTTLQLAFYGLQQGCLLCGSYTADTPPQPLENLVYAEDLGMIFFFGLGVRSGLWPPTLLGFQLFLSLLIVLGGAGAAALLGFTYRSILAALLTVGAVFGAGLLNPLPDATSEMLVRGYWAPAWVMVLVTACGVTLLTQFADTRRSERRWVGYGAAFLFGLTTGFGFLARSEAGYIALLYGAILLAWIIFGQRRWLSGCLVAAVIAIGLLLPLTAFQVTLAARVAWYDLPPVKPDAFPSHGIWHNAYIGLGYVANRWGIAWDDMIGWQVVQQQCPGVGYVTPQYFECLRHEFFQVVRADPALLLRNLVVKTGMLFALLLLTPAAIGASVAVALGRVTPRQLSLGLLVLLNLLPGLLAIPDRRYSQGFFMAVLVLGVIALLDFVQTPARLSSPSETDATRTGQTKDLR